MENDYNTINRNHKTMHPLKNIFYIICAVVQKDFRIERKNKEILTGVLVYALTVLLIIHFAFESFSLRAEGFSGGILWIAFTFSATIGLVRLFAHEEENGLWLALRLLPFDKGFFFLGKWLSALIWMLLAEWMITPLFSVLFNVRIIESVPALLLIYLLGSAGYAGAGVFAATVSLNTRMRGYFLPLLLFPLIIPVLIASVEATQQAISLPDSSVINSWTQMLVAYDLIILTAGFLMYEAVVEE